MRKLFKLLLILLFLTSCSKNLGAFGRGVSITFDPRTVGMQIDDTLMQKSLIGRLTMLEKKYFLSIQVEVLDGRIFVTGEVDEPEGKIKITKLAWETRGVREVKNAIEIKGLSNFTSNAKDVLITSQLRTAMILSKVIKSSNYTLETINKKIYIFGIAMNEDEKKLVIEEADKIYGVEKVIPVIYLVEDLSRSKS
mgnify:FL=1